MDIAVCAMVVGDEKSVVGNDASGTSEGHGNYGISDSRAWSIGVVYLSCRKLKTSFLHLLLQCRINGMYHPHALIGHGAIAACHGSYTYQCQFLKINHLSKIQTVVDNLSS